MSDDFYTVDELLDIISTTGTNEHARPTRIISGAAIDAGPPPTIRLSYLTASGALGALRQALNDLGISGRDTPIPKRLPSLPPLPTGSGNAPPGLPLPPVDPVLALQQLADAISRAEKTLNQENLLIASGDLNVDLSVDVGGVAGAHAQVNLRIEPKPYG